LELVREGRLEIRQDGAFQTIYLRKGEGRPVLTPTAPGTGDAH
jgi:segregation and condensation protein A